MAPIPPIDLLGSGQLEVCLIQKVGWLEGMAAPLATHVMLREPAQVGLNQRKETFFGGEIAGAPTLQELRYLSANWFRTGLHGHVQLILLQSCCPGRGSIKP